MNKTRSRTSRDAPWRPRASQGRLGNVSGASRERPRRILGAPGGSTSAPRGARQSARERPDTTKTDAKSHPGTKKSRSCCADRSRSTVASIFRRFPSFFGFSVKSANPLKYRACQQKQGFGHTSECRSKWNGFQQEIIKFCRMFEQNSTMSIEFRPILTKIGPSRSNFEEFDRKSIERGPGIRSGTNCDRISASSGQGHGPWKAQTTQAP